MDPLLHQLKANLPKEVDTVKVVTGELVIYRLVTGDRMVEMVWNKWTDVFEYRVNGQCTETVSRQPPWLWRMFGRTRRSRRALVARMIPWALEDLRRDWQLFER